MATFTSKRYRNLLLKTGGERVQFHNGSVEVPDHLVERVSEWAANHPEYQVERSEGAEAEKPLTAKQKVQAEAESLGLDASGTTAEIQARIDAHNAAEAAGGADDSDDESDGGQDDAAGSDEPEAGDSAQADEK